LNVGVLLLLIKVADVKRGVAPKNEKAEETDEGKKRR